MGTEGEANIDPVNREIEEGKPSEHINLLQVSVYTQQCYFHLTFAVNTQHPFASVLIML